MISFPLDMYLQLVFSFDKFCWIPGASHAALWTCILMLFLCLPPAQGADLRDRQSRKHVNTNSYNSVFLHLQQKQILKELFFLMTLKTDQSTKSHPVEYA